MCERPYADVCPYLAYSGSFYASSDNDDVDDGDRDCMRVFLVKSFRSIYFAVELHMHSS